MDNLIRYGKYIKDIQIKECGGYRRIRIIKYEGRLYLHHMFNGETIEIKELS